VATESGEVRHSGKEVLTLGNTFISLNTQAFDNPDKNTVSIMIFNSGLSRL
jgi:hypothetical protein